MKLTTLDVIKLLPLDDELKKLLLSEYNGFDEDKKFEIEQVVWTAFDTLHQLKLEENVRLALEKMGQNSGKIDPKFYEQIKTQTEQEMIISQHHEVSEVDLNTARKALESILQENSNSN